MDTAVCNIDSVVAAVEAYSRDQLAGIGPNEPPVDMRLPFGIDPSLWGRDGWDLLMWLATNPESRVASTDSTCPCAPRPHVRLSEFSTLHKMLRDVARAALVRVRSTHEARSKDS